MRWIVCVALFIFGLCGAGAAHAYTRSTVYPDGGGPMLYWGVRSVHYRINDAGYGPMPFEQVRRDLEDSFDAWAGHDCSDFLFVEDGLTGNGQFGYNRVYDSQPQLETDLLNEHLVVFRTQSCDGLVPPGDDCHIDSKNDDCDNKYNCWEDRANAFGDTIAVTLVTSQVATGRILDADTAFDAVDFAFGNVDAGGCANTRLQCMDIRNTMTHEAGHFLGLGHNMVDPATTMYPSAEPRETAKRVLAADDIAGLCAIYPKGKPPVTSVHRPKESSGYGCTSTSPLDAGTTGFALALVLFGLRRRSS